MVSRGIGADAARGRHDFIKQPRHSQMGISGIAITRRQCRFFEHRQPPFVQSLRRRLGQEPCLAEHCLDHMLDLDLQMVGDFAHAGNALGTHFDGVQTVADRLFARDIG